METLRGRLLRSDVNKEVTWREYLDEIVRSKPAAEKKQLYEAVHVTRTAFQRWRRGEYTPRASHIAFLLQALPQDERERLRALMLDDPTARALLPQEEILLGKQEPGRIPQSVYEEALRVARDTPERFWLLSGFIVSHALSQLETHPQQTGIQMVIARCMPPRPDGKIRSLRRVAGQGTPPWRQDFHLLEGFLGAESLAGAAVMKRHGVMVPDLLDSSGAPTSEPMDHEQSAAAYPLLREGAIAGALLVSCRQAQFFTPERLKLIERYADLLRLAFYDHEFYPSAQIDLGWMPAWPVQQPSFRTFRQRVQEEYQRALREGALSEVSLVEERVRAMLEEELLKVSSSQDEPLSTAL
jgi:hypothetical protein